MKITVRAALVCAVIASSIGGPALAQQRPSNHNQPNHANANHGQANHARANHGPQRPVWHERQASRGHSWRKGQRLAANQRRYVVNDWNQRGLRAPPRGYQWVRENNNSGDFLLVAAATGLIASILSQ